MTVIRLRGEAALSAVLVNQRGTCEEQNVRGRCQQTFASWSRLYEEIHLAISNVCLGNVHITIPGTAYMRECCRQPMSGVVIEQVKGDVSRTNGQRQGHHVGVVKAMSTESVVDDFPKRFG